MFPPTGNRFLFTTGTSVYAFPNIPFSFFFTLYE